MNEIYSREALDDLTKGGLLTWLLLCSDVFNPFYSSFINNYPEGLNLTCRFDVFLQVGVPYDDVQMVNLWK